MEKNISIETIDIGGVNAYVITGDEGAILIDTGYYSNREKLYNRVKDKDLKFIILTHGHVDHIGAAYYIAQKLGISVGIHVEDVALLKDNCCRARQADNFIGKMIKIISECGNQYNHYDDLKIDLFLEEGMTLEYGNLKCKIIELPGHTRGSIGVIINENIFVGDAMMNMLKPTKARLYENLEETIKSQDKILEQEIENIYTGHGPSFKKNEFRR